ncbi:hypothetical protein METBISCDRAFT_15301 [Metschnikowia bicuspidata]|uniref:RRM domain-containing protein n=1 Tax=Metschnikowia bicuspidata TaxID=27322 RepID=A0A4V1J354_9ASCO|nr:hypothetical protein METBISCDRAFT_15301 [Metschnikowia bicuspidata]
MTPANVLKLSNLPPEITLREAHLIFSLVNDDILNIDLSDYLITVYFKTLSTCITTGKLLDGKFIFGRNCPPVKVDLDSTLTLTGATSAFESLRLSSYTISPPSTHLRSVQQPPKILHLHPGSASGSSFDNFQKRPSIGSQRLRFLFSDPFAGASASAGAPLSSVTGTSGSIVLGDLTSTSLMMMNQNEPRDFDNLTRDPWSSLNQPLTSNPQTPGLASVTKAFDWGATSNTASNQSSHNPAQPQYQSGSQPQQGLGSLNSSPPGLSHVPLNSSNPNPANERRRTSAFFNGGQSTAVPLTAVQSQPHLATVTNSLNPSGPQSMDSLQSGSKASNSSSQPVRKDVPDLSLLAKVPLPANPADQNPPCNTLYVGNLPHDATEAELRALFSPQKGFRRLSFRTKNQSSNSNGGLSGHNHGPMCFVEFDDVLLATEALADLYGSALPRTNGSSSKGGIRLSFSKNPLGVRGPGNPRRSSANQLNSLGGSANNGVGNYGYLSFR